MPWLISMCEDSDGCSNWGFDGNHATGLWADGANPDLTITHVDATSISNSPRGQQRHSNLRDDKAASFGCFLTDANTGNDHAETTVGIYYYAGWGTPVDYKKSYDWLAKAAAQDNPDALKALSIPFFAFRFCYLLIVGWARSAALRSRTRRVVFLPAGEFVCVLMMPVPRIDLDIHRGGGCTALFSPASRMIAR
jgi:hypothetical protein